MKIIIDLNYSNIPSHLSLVDVIDSFYVFLPPSKLANVQALNFNFSNDNIYKIQFIADSSNDLLDFDSNNFKLLHAAILKNFDI